MIKLDLGCGPRKKEGFVGLDQFAMDGVDVVHKVTAGVKLPFEDGSVEEVYSSHFVEHLNAVERCWLMNELWRIMVPGGKAFICVPNWASCRAYGDPTHAWPPMGAMWGAYLSKAWRLQEAPHTDASFLPWGYACDFEPNVGLGLNPKLVPRNDEYRQMAAEEQVEAVWDLHFTLVRSG